MDLGGVKDCWNELARKNPVASMLASDLKAKITNVDELFASGEREIHSLMLEIERLGINIPRGKVVDFGCGLGRSSQALATYFDEVYGIDIAPAIIELADKYNRYNEKCKYLLNQTNDLKIIESASIDFVWSYGALHLIEPRYFENYIREFFRILAPGGMAVFHQAAEPARTIKGRILRITPGCLVNLHHKRKYGFEVYSMKRDQVIKLIGQSGGRTVNIKKEYRTPGPNWISFQYYALKKGSRGVDDQVAL
jgi:SAM-dependent methyltransferase